MLLELTRESLLKLPNFHGSAVSREPAQHLILRELTNKKYVD